MTTARVRIAVLVASPLLLMGVVACGKGSQAVRPGSGGGVQVVMVGVSFLVATQRHQRGAEPIHHETTVSGTHR